MSSSGRRVIALGNLAGELKSSLDAAVRGAELELHLTREPARAFVELEREGAVAVLLDIATLGAEQFCKRARSAERLRGVPVIGMSRHPNELGFARVFAWGADDLVPLGVRLPLERRLKVLANTVPPDATSFGQAVVAEATTQRRALVGRVLAHAGYAVKFAIERGAVELYASQSETRLVVISAALGDPRRMIEAAAKAGALPTWIVTAEMRSVNRLSASLAGLDRVAVTSTAGSPEDVLFLANELVFGKGPRRSEWRALYATPVAFRAADVALDEYGFSYDASANGIYVRSLLPCETEEVELELRLPAREERVRLHGKVARRFAFGSGSIASAPPGFGVKLDGPEEALGRWAEACSELIAGASSEGPAPPPRAKPAGAPVRASPSAPGPEVGLALPPATLTIESVVAPLPVDEGPPLGDLLAQTLDEQTLAAVGTRPVTINPETFDVREERPSEMALLPPSEPPPPPEAPPPPAAGKPAAATAEGRGLPLPAPGAGRDRTAQAAPTRVEEPPVPAAEEEETPAEELDPDATPTIVPAAPTGAASPADWESEAKTTVRASSPEITASGTVMLEPAPAPPLRADAPRLPLPRKSGTRPGAPAPEAARPPPVPAPQFPPPPVPREPFLLARDEPEPRPEPSPRQRVDTEPFASEPRPVAPVQPAASLQTPAQPFARTLLQAEPVQFDSAPTTRIPEAKRPAPLPPAATAPAAVASPAPVRSGGPRRGPRWGLIGLGVVALGALGGVALVFLRQAAQAPHPGSPEVPEPAALSAPRPADPNAPATAAASAPTVWPGAGEQAPEAPRTAVAPSPPSATVAPSTTAAPSAIASTTPSAAAAPNAAVPSATPAPTPAAVPDIPLPSVDPTKMPPERGALFVRSSVSAHVFVHGTDYGETNTKLITTCGIRFVRLGRSTGGFLEPGQSYVIKCGKLTELRIEPASSNP